VWTEAFGTSSGEFKAMQACTTHIHDINDLKEFVHKTICDQNELEPGVFPLAERILARGGKPCGIFFCLYGPRSVKLTAIWETERNTILFYGSSGERIMRTELAQVPQLAMSVA
jgi:hypothetical protein